MIEFAAVGLLVFTVLLAVFEFGLLLRDNLRATDAVSDAVRAGAIIGPDTLTSGANADFEIVKAVRDGLGTLDEAAISRIIVFKAGGSSAPAEEQVPTSCRRGTPVPGVCNVYDATAAFRAVVAGDTAYFECAPSGPACAWRPNTRKDGPTSADVETVGDYIQIDRDGYTGLFASTWTITRAMTLRLEPGVIE